MTYLLLDIGNSRVKWALSSESQKLSNVGRAHHPTSGIESFAQQHWGGWERPSGVMISCVGSLKIIDQITLWLKKTWGIVPQILISPPQGWGVTNAYTEPSKLGSDRWAGLVAARQRTKRPCFVADCGTAVTLDVLTAEGEHQGGFIVPGLTLMRDSLTKRTARVRPTQAVSVNRNSSLLARDTFGAMHGGTLYALIALLDRVVADVELELGESVQRIITGGDGPTLLPLLSGHYDHVPDLVLEGLAVMAGGP